LCPSTVTMLDTTDPQQEYLGRSHVVALNYTILGLVDELLWLPSASVVVTAVHLLYGREASVPEALLRQPGRGAPLSLSGLVALDAPLGALLPSRLGPAAAWRAATSRLKDARAVSRDRYRQLQMAFVSATAGGMVTRAGSLVRDMYGGAGRWPCADSARRLLVRAARVNRAALALLAATARGECGVRLEGRGPLPVRSYDLPEATLDVLAEALPPIVVPDFSRLAIVLGPGGIILDGEESIDRYQSLFAEMLSLSGHVEVRS
jgi:hypothetical protein